MRDTLKQAQQHHQAGRLTQAERLYRRILQKQPRNADALNLLGALAGQTGRFDEGVGLIRHAIAIKGKVGGYHTNLGNLLLRTGRMEEAAAAYRRALKLNPEAADAHSNLSITLRERGQFAAAVASAGRAVALRPRNAGFHNNLGLALQGEGTFEEAAGAFRKAIALNPKFAEAHNNLGILLRNFGRFEEAAETFGTAIRLNPGYAAAYYNLANARGIGADDELLHQMVRLVDETPPSQVHERTHLFFAISTVYRERGEDEKSFLYLKLANQTVRGAIAYDPAANDEGFRRLKTVFARHFLDSIAEAGFASELPVFIVGMPRSGTTLIEQIVASHPAVHGAGERKELGLFLNELGAGHGGEREFPDFVTDLEPGAFRELGERYVAALRPLAPDAERIVDKMPGNFVHVGLIAAALPDARVIHCLRDPLDTCLSCYEQYFQKAQPYCYDLEELGRFYRLYENLMEHWCAVLPGRILEVRYEDVVRDLEGEARRLIAFCGLDWSDACLAFHETERMVRTASANQVRQPLYATSVGRWRRFERELAPLIAALGI